jgi:hypothetical protein
VFCAITADAKIESRRNIGVTFFIMWNINGAKIRIITFGSRKRSV